MLPRRYLHGFVLLNVIFAFSGMADAQPAVWELYRGDRFTVETVIEQTTTVAVAESEPVTTKQTETLQVEYRVSRVLPVETQFLAQITKAESSDESASLRTKQRISLLEGLGVQLAVDQFGLVRVATGYERFISSLADRDEKLMASVLPLDVLTSWLGRPFWIIAGTDTAEKDTEWDRVDNMSVGLLGTIRTIATCKIGSIDGNTATVELSGSGRHVASASERASHTLKASEVELETVSLTGQGKMWLAPVTDEEKDENKPVQPEKRPGFESLSLQWEVKGKAKLEDGAKNVNVSFQHTQKQTSRLLPGFRTGGEKPRLNIPGFPDIPIPR